LPAALSPDHVVAVTVIAPANEAAISKNFAPNRRDMEEFFLWVL
jgi:hypothetical protein